MTDFNAAVDYWRPKNQVPGFFCPSVGAELPPPPPYWDL
jgi:hypothetical protein